MCKNCCILSGHREVTFSINTCSISPCLLKVSDAVQDTVVLEEVLRMVLEIINSCFVHQVSDQSTSVSDPHFFADPDPGNNLHADPDQGLRGKMNFF